MHGNWLEALGAEGPHPSLGAHARTYGRVIGSWRGELRSPWLGEAAAPGSVEAHFAWVLQGRAVQDVWIAPARSDPRRQPPPLTWHGTTLRVFDPALEAWRVVWTDPLTQLRIELIGRQQGDDIVQLGTRAGRLLRWTFSAIQAKSFRWQGHALGDDGRSWEPEVEIEFQRQ
jgi:hypothetical protein